MRLVVLCYALSLGAHAGLLGWLINTPIDPAPPYAGRANDMPDGQRRPVAVTITMKMSDFAQPGQSQPSNRPDPPTAPETAGPASAGGQTPTHDSQPDPPGPTQTAALDEPDRPAAVAPPPRNAPDNQPDRPQVAELPPHGVPPAAPPPQRVPEPASRPMKLDLEAVARQADEALDNIRPLLEELMKHLPDESLASKAHNSQHSDSAVAQAVSQIQTPESASPATAAADTNEQGREAEEAPTQAQAPAEPDPGERAPQPAATDDPPAVATAATPADDATEEDASPAARVYDQQSVDQAITFNTKARPKPSAVSQRLGDRGTIRILIEVDAEGGLVGYDVIDDAGQPRLLAAAIKALEASTFHPATREGQAVRSTWGVEYRF